MNLRVAQVKPKTKIVGKLFRRIAALQNLNDEEDKKKKMRN